MTVCIHTYDVLKSDCSSKHNEKTGYRRDGETERKRIFCKRVNHLNSIYKHTIADIMNNTVRSVHGTTYNCIMQSST